MNRYTHENEIVEQVDLCDPGGNLNPGAIGFSRNPLQVCNLSGHPLRKKKWNYWCFTNKDYLFSITISNVDYLGMVFAYYLDMNTKEYHELTVTTLLGAGCEMNQVVHGKISFQHSKLNVEFNDTGSEVSICVSSADFGNRKLEAVFKVFRPESHETLNVTIPWSHHRFQFTSKQTCLPVTGWVKLDDKKYEFDRTDSYACLDYGRGVWKYSSKWNWASFAGLSGDHSIGVNLGGQWTDGTGYTENGLIVDGRLIKIGSDITFEYDKKNYMKPWLIQNRRSTRVKLGFYSDI